jgi:chromosome segregation ATPase
MQRKRVVTFSIIVAAILGIAIFLLVRTAPPELADNSVLPVTRTSDHDLYNPARTALVNARAQLAETFSQEEDILEQMQRVHRELDESLTLLANARQIDPAMKAPIDALRARLSALEDDRAVAHMDTETLRGIYQRLLADFEALIQHY